MIVNSTTATDAIFNLNLFIWLLLLVISIQLLTFSLFASELHKDFTAILVTSINIDNTNISSNLA